ncbi:MAG: response regulator [Candidatus Sumerlaeia bacterium]|nr:response regulator [Candidatus Sumerlaeia bacterium]
MTTKVLIVDDNELYRSAFRRNLLLRDYEVFEAENGEEALRVFQESAPEVVVTDLNMRTPTEGLEVIRAIKQIEPLVPIVMISAVGSFEEGAEATRLGAHSVIGKARIDEEMESLYRTIESARETWTRNFAARQEVARAAENAETLDAAATARLREIIGDMRLHASIRGEAYDALALATEADVRRGMQEQIQAASNREIDEAERRLKDLLPAFDTFDPDTRKELRTAEYFFHRQGGDAPGVAADFSRNIGFSFCFAVENEAKVRLRKRLNRFLSQKDTIRLIRDLIDSRGQLDLFFHQYMARMQGMCPFDFTIDNVRQVFQRILEHESRYKPDGLKALGIIIVCFGRTYEIKSPKRTIKIDNPLNLRGITDDEEVKRFAYILVALQHFRNPYIHPEISEMEKISKIRDTTFDCLREISRLA